MEATFRKLEVVGIDEAKRARFIKREAKGIQKAGRRFGNEISDADALKSAEKMADIYSHHFRIWK